MHWWIIEEEVNFSEKERLVVNRLKILWIKQSETIFLNLSSMSNFILLCFLGGVDVGGEARGTDHQMKLIWKSLNRSMNDNKNIALIINLYINVLQRSKRTNRKIFITLERLQQAWMTSISQCHHVWKFILKHLLTKKKRRAFLLIFLKG